jgi:hypothetical protein
MRRRAGAALVAVRRRRGAGRGRRARGLHVGASIVHGAVGRATHASTVPAARSPTVRQLGSSIATEPATSVTAQAPQPPIAHDSLSGTPAASPASRRVSPGRTIAWVTAPPRRIVSGWAAVAGGRARRREEALFADPGRRHAAGGQRGSGRGHHRVGATQHIYGGVVVGHRQGVEARGDRGLGQRPAGVVEDVVDGEAATGGQRRQLVGEDHRGAVAVAVDERQAGGWEVGQRPRDRDDGRDAAAASDRDDVGRRRGGVEGEVARRAQQAEAIADRGALGQERRDPAAGDPLDGDRDPARLAGVRRRRVGAAQALTVDGDLDREELPGAEGQRRAGGIDQGQGHRVGGLAADGLDHDGASQGRGAGGDRGRGRRRRGRRRLDGASGTPTAAGCGRGGRGPASRRRGEAWRGAGSMTGTG